MKALLQRVTEASVSVGGETSGAIGPGLLVFVGIERDDSLETADRMLQRILAYRLFADEAGRMNRNVVQAGGGVLLVSQFTLAADTSRGLRPSFSSALAPGEAEPLFDYLWQQLQAAHAPVACGRFGADMQVALTNDGPVTFLLEVS